MCRSMVDIRSTAAEIRRGKKRRKKKERNYRAKIYMVSLLHRATINEDEFLGKKFEMRVCLSAGNRRLDFRRKTKKLGVFKLILLP